MGAPDALARALQTLETLDGVAEAAGRAREAGTRLRWHEGLRRRWREARAETAVRCAAAGAAVDGARVDVAALRAHAAGLAVPEPDPAMVVAVGVWRAQAEVDRLLPPLGGRGRGPSVPARELLAALHRDLVAGLVASGALPADAAGRPRRGAERPREEGAGPAGPGVAVLGDDLDARIDVLCALADTGDGPALARVAVVHAEIATVRPFVVGNGSLARAMARLLAVRTGLEPTGVAVLDAHPAADPLAYRRALAGYATGTPDGVAAWLRYQAECLVVGAEQGAQVATAVLAGRLPAG